MQHPYYQSILLIERLHRQFLELVKAELERRGIHDINNVQSLILYNISNDDLTVGELTARGYYLGSNVSYNVKKMVENGYLVQERSLHDRRSVRVRLSDKGLALRDKLREMFERQVDGLQSASINEASINELNRSLIEMERYLVGRLGYAIGGSPTAA